MKTILISLVSEQTVPNILAIHHFKPDELLFISTRDMEAKGKTSAILDTMSRLGLKYQRDMIMVQEDSILDCHRQLEEWIKGREDSEFVVNLTGGTKIMSIAAYEFFKDYSSRMIYVPIPRNEFIVPFPKKSPGRPTEFDLRLSVVQYLAAYGLKVVNEGKLETYCQEARKRKGLSELIVQNYAQLKNLLLWLCGMLRPHRSEKMFELTGNFTAENQEEKDFFSRFGFSYSGGIITRKLDRSDIRYLTGGWLEEYCFNIISEWLGCGIDDVAIGLQLRNSRGRENEFDVMFTKDNALYFAECKSLDQDEDEDASQALYKIGALQREFGLRVKSFFVTTSPYILKDGKVREAIQARSEQFQTWLVSPTEIGQLKEIIAQKLNIHQGEIS
ncbi:MAG: DUF1887 family CARF protein [bacterium]